MRLVNFQIGGSTALGARVGDTIIDLSAAGLPSSVDELLEGGSEALAAAGQAITDARRTHPLSAVRLLAPVLRPRHALAVGLNYRDHATEAGLEPPAHPTLFARFPSSWVGPGEAIIRPAESDSFDFEAELAVVIGKPGRNIAKARALDHVAGYSLFNDGTIREFQFRTSQWTLGKNFDRTGAFGPELVTADELPAGASGLTIEGRLNGEVVQHANTDDMLFDVATIIHAVSQALQLLPGDVIFTGTPAGIGWTRSPRLLLQPGDVFEVAVEGIHSLVNTVAGGD